MKTSTSKFKSMVVIASTVVYVVILLLPLHSGQVMYCSHLNMYHRIMIFRQYNIKECFANEGKLEIYSTKVTFCQILSITSFTSNPYFVKNETVDIVL